MQLTLRIILAGVLLWAATAKLRDPRALVLVGPTARWAAAGAAVLGMVFAASLLRMRAAGARRARCARFGGSRAWRSSGPGAR